MPQPPKPPPDGPRVPPNDPTAAETGKRYMRAFRELANAQLTVTATDGPVRNRYAPGRVASGLATRVTTLLTEVGSGFEPMFYGALGGASLSLFFGDPLPEDESGQLPIQATAQHAQRIARLIDLDGDDLFAHAVALGRPAASYAELARFVEGEGFTMTWAAAGDEPRVLEQTRAAAQVAILTAEPPSDPRQLTIFGELYRVITDRKDTQLGTIGVRLYSWSPRPPARGGLARQTVIAPYASTDVEGAIKSGLIGEPVEVQLLIRQPRPGYSIDPQNVTIEVVEIKSGPGENSRLGDPMF